MNTFPQYIPPTFLSPGYVCVPVPQRVLEFATVTENRVVQINGQRYFGPSLYVNPYYEPGYGSEVFLSRIPREFHEPELVPYLENAGTFYQLRLMMDFSGNNRGYCFVKYFDPFQANHAVNLLNGFEMQPGRPIDATISSDNRTLVFSGIPTNRYHDEITDRINNISEGVVDITIPWKQPANQPKGIAFVTYVSHSAAAQVRKWMITHAIYFWNMRVTVQWAEPDFLAQRNGCPTLSSMHHQLRVLIVKNVDPKIRTRVLRQIFHFQSYNGVRRLLMDNGRAFVYFKTRAQAEAAKTLLNGVKVGKYHLKIEWPNHCRIPPIRTKRPSTEVGKPNSSSFIAKTQDTPAKATTTVKGKAKDLSN